MNIKKMIPFMDEDGIREIAEAVLNNEEGCEDISLSSLLPFMDEDDVDDIAIEIYRREGIYKGILPFMSDERIGDLAREFIKNDEEKNITDLLPFMDDDDIDEIFLKLAEKGINNTAMYPYVSDDGWHDVLQGYLKGKYEFDFDEAYPFMDEDDIRDLFRYEIRKHRKK